MSTTHDPVVGEPGWTNSVGDPIEIVGIWKDCVSIHNSVRGSNWPVWISINDAKEFFNWSPPPDTSRDCTTYAVVISSIDKASAYFGGPFLSLPPAVVVYFDSVNRYDKDGWGPKAVGIVRITILNGELNVEKVEV